MELVDKISADLQLPKDYLLKLKRTASFCYKTYTIPKPTGGKRTIHHPSKELKAVQRWFLEHIVACWPVSPHAVAYMKGKNIADNATIHVSGHFLLRLDLSNFFPSITAEDIRNYLNTHPGSVAAWSSGDRDFFISIVCRDDCLTIGAPTSPALSNAICFKLDSNLQQVASAKGMFYSRYADDLFFSSANPNQLGKIEGEVDQVLRALDCPSGLSLNRRKTHHSSKKGRRIVTGIILTSDGHVSVGRRRKREVRALLHKYEQLDLKQKRKLAGLLAFACDIEPDLVNSLILKYGADLVAKARKFQSAP